MARVILRPAIRARVAELHADQVFRKHLAPLSGAVSVATMADMLNERGVLPVRGGGPWNEMRVHRLLRIAQRGWNKREG